jgi:hypothetical protein
VEERDGDEFYSTAGVPAMECEWRDGMERPSRGCVAVVRLEQAELLGKNRQTAQSGQAETGQGLGSPDGMMTQERGMASAIDNGRGANIPGTQAWEREPTG